jgi:hypothetical protein
MSSGNDNISTAIGTFSGATFENLTTLNLSGAVFAATGMSSDSDAVFTASQTFSGATFGSLTTLNLSGATVFAVNGMSSTGGAYNINTANETFSGATFGSLTTLNLSGAVFAASDMSSGAISTAYGTFYGANLQAMHGLSLPDNQPEQT